MADDKLKGFRDAASGITAKDYLDQIDEKNCRELVAVIFKRSEEGILSSLTNGAISLGDDVAKLAKEEMEQLFKRYSKGGFVKDLKLGDQGNHNLEVRMKSYGNDQYSIALYEDGKKAGIATSPNLEKSAHDIYEDNPLTSTVRPAAAPAVSRPQM